MADSECWLLGTTDCQLLHVSLDGNQFKLVFEDSRSDGVSCRLSDRVPSHAPLPLTPPPLPGMPVWRQTGDQSLAWCDVRWGDATDRQIHSAAVATAVSLTVAARLKRIAGNNRYMCEVIDIAGFWSLSIIISIIVHRFQPYWKLRAVINTNASLEHLSNFLLRQLHYFDHGINCFLAYDI